MGEEWTGDDDDDDVSGAWFRFVFLFFCLFLQPTKTKASLSSPFKM